VFKLLCSPLNSQKDNDCLTVYLSIR